MIFYIDKMFMSSNRILRSLFSQQSLKITSKNVLICTADLRWNSQVLTSNLVNNKEVPKLSSTPNQEEAIRKTAKLIKEYSNPEIIKWEQFKRKLNKLNITDHRLAVLQACLRLKDLDTGISYFNYVIKNGEEFTPVELVFFLKLFDAQRSNILKYEDVVKYVYDKIKALMNSNVIQNYIISLVSEVPSCFYDLVKNICDEKANLYGAQKLANKAFELKNPELAYEIMDKYKVHISGVFKSYINYLCQLAMENKFSPDMITTCLKFCENKNYIISSSNFFSLLTTLVNILNEHDKNYKWNLKKCYINDFNVCSECKEKLAEKCISETDFSALKNAFLPTAALVDRSVFLNSSDKEIQQFLEFLKNSKPYNIVFDGLNLMYLYKNISCDLSRILKHFLDKGMSVLIVARVHAQKQIRRMHFLKKKNYSERCQFFFTENLSDDDLFVLYAALHGGLGTYLISGDFLQGYGARFDDRLKQIFFKWKSYHQFIINKVDLHPPLPSLGLAQLTTNENENKFIWHISYISEDSANDLLNPLTPVEWVCLQAEKKS